MLRELPHTNDCFVCGESNPSGLKLRFQTDGKTVTTHFLPSDAHIGFQHVIHGGIIATVLDEIMVWACAVSTGQFAYCAEMTVRFNNPLRPDHQVLATGELETNRRGKLFTAKAELRNPHGLLLASASGKYLPIKKSELPAMLTDLRCDSPDFFNSLK